MTTAPPGIVVNVTSTDHNQRMSLRARVTLLVAACVAGAVALVSLGAYLVVYNGLYDQVDEKLQARANSLVNDQRVVDTGGAEIPGFYVQIADIRLDVINSAGLSVLRRAVPEPPPVARADVDVAAGRSESSLRTDATTGTRVLTVRYRLPETALVLAQPLDSTKATLGKLAVVLIVIGAAGVIVAAGAGTAVARGGLSPVQRLTEATERVTSTGDLRPIPVSGDDELARLTQSFNTMLGAVSDAQDRQRRLVADAGHELRTPLTSLRTNLELLLSAEQPGAPSLAAQDKVEIHDDLRAQLDELTQLIGDLVELARDDAPRTVLTERVDLVDVVEAALERARRRAGTIRFDVSLQPWTLLGDAPVLERAVLNLLDNAVKFSPPEATVRVDLRSTGDGHAFLTVADAGPGISDADLPHVFDRFYRSQEARTLPGSGLGLAIVKQAAERHGGAVYAARSADGGALMAIRLPGVPDTT